MIRNAKAFEHTPNKGGFWIEIFYCPPSDLPTSSKDYIWDEDSFTTDEL